MPDWLGYALLGRACRAFRLYLCPAVRASAMPNQAVIWVHVRFTWRRAARIVPAIRARQGAKIHDDKNHEQRDADGRRRDKSAATLDGQAEQDEGQGCLRGHQQPCLAGNVHRVSPPCRKRRAGTRAVQKAKRLAPPAFYTLRGRSRLCIRKSQTLRD